MCFKFCRLNLLFLLEEHHIDSPFDDSDIDPDYDPAEEINPRAGKRKKKF